MPSALRRLPAPWVLALALVAFAAADWSDQAAGAGALIGGVPDEIAHLLTALLVLWACGQRACERFLIPAALASVLIDLDHIPNELGATWLTAGTPRPYTHSLLAVAAVAVAGVAWRRRRDVLLGIAIGFALHLWRDVSEVGSGASVLWPFSDRAYTLPHWSYLAAISIVAAVAVWRVARPRASAATVTGEPRRAAGVRSAG